MKSAVKIVLFTLSLVIMSVVASACTKDKVEQNEEEEITADGRFRAGVSTVDVTGTVPSGYTLHDQLFARTLVLDDGETRLAMVVADKLKVPREVFDEAKRLIANETGIPSQNVMMAPTHTHSATVAHHNGTTSNGYTIQFTWSADHPLQSHQILLARQLADGVKSAVANLEPARIGWGVADGSKWAFNRRWIMKNPVKSALGGWDDVMFNPGTGNSNRDRPAGPIDPDIPFIAVQSAEGRPMAILANYSTHYAGGVPENHISADYYGVFSDKIRQLVGAGNRSQPFVGIMSNGAGGDVNTINYHYNQTQPTYPPYQKMQLVANDVAEDVFRVYRTIQYHDWVRLGTAQSELTLQVRRADPELLQYVQDMRAGLLPQWHPTRDRMQAGFVLQLENEWPDSFPVLLQAFRIGDLAICAVPFEVFAQTGLDIKRDSPFPTTFTMGIANGTYGYLPTPEQHELGGYETWMGSTSKVQKDASELIKDRLSSLLSSLVSD